MVGVMYFWCDEFAKSLKGLPNKFLIKFFKKNVKQQGI